MLLRALAALLCLAALNAAQPTLTTIASLPGGVEDQAYTITYADLLAASDASGDTARFKVTILGSGTLVSVPHGASLPQTPVVTPFYLDASTDLLWTPDPNDCGNLTVCLVRANDGLGTLAINISTTDVMVPIYLTPLVDPHTAHAGVNARTDLVARLVPVTEDTWTEFTYADLIALTETVEVDGDPITFVLTSLGDGTLATSSGGAALSVGAEISGGSLWWLPSANTFTKQGATAADDEAPIRFATCSVRKTHLATNYDLTGITLTSTIDGVDDPFVGTTTGFTPLTVVRGHSVTLTIEELFTHFDNFPNTDRDARLDIDLGQAGGAGWKLAGFNPVAPDTPVNECTGVSSSVYDYYSSWSIRITPPTTLATGTYVIGIGGIWDPVTATNGMGNYIAVQVVEAPPGVVSDSGGGGGCAGGSSLSLLCLLLVLGLGLTRRVRP